jgi:hypothetical protein
VADDLRIAERNAGVSALSRPQRDDEVRSLPTFEALTIAGSPELIAVLVSVPAR